MKHALLLLALAGCATPESAPARAGLPEGNVRVYEVDAPKGTRAFLVIYGDPLPVARRGVKEE